MNSFSFFTKTGEEKWIQIPYENEFIDKDIQWGKNEELFTPSFWYTQTIMNEITNNEILNYQIGTGSLIEETIACLIGGYGIPSEIGNAKFRQIQVHLNELLILPNLEKIESIMSKPLINNKKQEIKYRFIKQKSRYIFDALLKLKKIEETNFSDLELRNELLKINGIGPKTASWIVRNYRKSDCVAIIDIHIHRAGLLAGFFNIKDNLQKDYFKMEKKFLNFCNNINLSAAKVDAVIWRTMKTLNSIVLKELEKQELIQN